MGITKSSVPLLMMILALCCGASMATLYKVGDAAGWTRKVPVDYYQWSSGKKFFVGDSLLFQYNASFHDVMEVTLKNFMQCSTQNPIEVHTSGSDKIALNRPGHYFFICSTPGHCQSGQKFSIKVEYRPGQIFAPSEDENPAEEQNPSDNKAADKAPGPSSGMPPHPEAEAPWYLKAAPIPAPGPKARKNKN